MEDWLISEPRQSQWSRFTPQSFGKSLEGKDLAGIEKVGPNEVSMSS